MTKLNAAAKVQMSIDPRLLSMTQLANSATAALSRTPSMPRLVEAVANFQAQEQQRELDVASLSTSSDLLARIRARRSPAETRCKRCLRASEPCSLKPMRRRPSASERLPHARNG